MLTIRNHKFIALLLCFVMVATSVAQFLAPATVHAAESADLTILEWDPEAEEGEPIDKTFITEGGETTLKVKGATGDVQWQFYAEEVDTWISIYGETKDTIVLKYAKVANMLDDVDKTKIRCIQKDGDKVIESNEIGFYVRPMEAAATFPFFSMGRAINEDQTATVEDTEAGDEELQETCLVVIRYMKGKTMVATEWTGTAIKGNTITNVEPVVSPTVLGYAPAEVTVNPPVEGFTPDPAEINLKDYGPINSNVTITVEYEPVFVNFSVEHYQQNLEDDKYPEVPTKIVSKTGYTDDQVGDKLALNYTGFYALPYDPTTLIAADGSTVVYVYYDRMYYLMSLDLDGGHGVEPVYAKYGTKIEIGTPTKAGYTFAGWKAVNNNGEVTGDLLTSAQISGTMPAANTKYKAIWTPGDTTFDVVYWYENANDNKYSQAGAQYDITVKSGTVVDGETYKGYAFSGRDNEHFTFSHADEDVKINGDGSTVVNVYFARKVYTITYVMGSWANKCNLAEHRHTDECKGLKCSTHTEECEKKLTCETTEHIEHTADCLACTKPVHEQHTDACCTITTSHTHSEICYITNYSRSGRCNLGQHPNNPTDGTTHSHTYGYYRYTCVYYNGNWYYYDMNNNVNQNVCTAHVHGEGCVYSDEIHVHGDACYSDVIHKHTDECYTYNCDCVDHTHISECYELKCGKWEHYHSGNTCYLLVTTKYDADITKVWEESPVKDVIDGGYVFQSNITQKYYSFLEKMPGYDLRMTKSSFDGYTKYTWYYYLEVLPGSDTTGKTIRTDSGKTYELYHTSSVYASGLSLTYAEDYFPITGFTQRDKTVPKFSNATAYLYYTRNSYNLTFSNYGDMVEDKGGTFYYEQDISDQYFKPDYPADLEANAYEFDGWYTSPFFGDTRFEFTYKEDGKTLNATMPANDITLYAKWVPKTHNVNIYLTNDMSADNKVGDTQVVAHRAQAANPYGDEEPVHPDSELYEFVGWFYDDVDSEGKTVTKAFDFSMPITKDLNLYAKWSSKVMVDYTIRYELADGTKIAEDTIGQALAGTSKTFEAKVGDALKEGYQTGYYPQTSSHNLDILIESDNVYTFIYEKKDFIEYTVKYLEYGTNAEIYEQEVKSTTDAVVVETFKPKTGYMPDAYQKQMALSSVAENNVIVFWYTKDDVHAPVQVIHYVQNAAGTAYTEYLSTTDLSGVINKDYSVNVLELTGYDFARATANENAVNADENGKVTAKVTANGLLIELYYDRELHPYEFMFLEQGTNKVIAESETGTGRYGDKVKEDAKDIAGYKLVSATPQEIRIQLEDDRNVALKNVKIFYYVENEVPIHYEVVGPDGCGEVSPESETVKVVSGNADGSVATANQYYSFKGWYSDPDCTKLITTNAHYTPKKTGVCNVYDAETNITSVVDAYEEKTYYAKFEENNVALNYEVVGPEGCGTVTPEQETVRVLTGVANGSTASAYGKIYKFVGWYADAACETLLSTDADYKPTKEAGAAWVDGTTYYAKFDYNLTKLVITKTGIDEIDHHAKSGDSEAEYQTVMFKITGPDYEQTVAVCGNNSVVIDGLVVGDEYTITEITDWSWRYAPEQSSYKITLEPDIAKNAVVVKNKRVVKNDENDNWKWLNGGAYTENGFGGVSK